MVMGSYRSMKKKELMEGLLLHAASTQGTRLCSVSLIVGEVGVLADLLVEEDVDVVLQVETVINSPFDLEMVEAVDGLVLLVATDLEKKHNKGHDKITA